nr:4728_t:CDS:2 [Entrophospora candida]
MSNKNSSNPAFSDTLPNSNSSSNSSNIINSTRIYGHNIQFFTSSRILYLESNYNVKIKNSECSPPMIQYTGKDAPGFSCLPNGCCLPCPFANTLYPENLIDSIYLILSFVRVISFTCIFALVISYLVLPNKREHPAMTVLLFNASLLLFISVTFFYIGDHKKVQCYNEITQSDITNNPFYCGVQVAVSFTVLPGITGEINYEFGASHWSLNKPGPTMTDSTDSDITATTSTMKPNINFKTSHEVVRILKIQWRALLLAILLLITFLVYWTYEIVELPKLKRLYDDAKPEWVSEWLACILEGNGQNMCSKISVPHIPRVTLMIISESFTATLGISVFLVFGTSINLWAEWKVYFINRFGELSVDNNIPNAYK